MAAQRLDCGIQFREAPFQYRRRIVLRAVHQRANVLELQPRIAVHANLAQAAANPARHTGGNRRPLATRLQQPMDS